MTQLQFNLDIDFLKESVMNSNLDLVLKSSIVLILKKVYISAERNFG